MIVWKLNFTFYFFWSGVIVAIFNQLGKQTCDIELLIILFISGTSTLMCFFTMLDGMGSSTSDVIFDFLIKPSNSSTLPSVNSDNFWPLLKSAVGSYKGKFMRWSLIVKIYDLESQSTCLLWLYLLPTLVI